MLFSFALIFLLGLFLSYLFMRLHLPGLLGMLITGIFLGPHYLNLIHPTILNISADLRRIALVIILTRAGLALNFDDLKKSGRPAILLCFLPACLEIICMILLAPRLLSITYLEAALLGSVIAAVSPAVIVPKMLKLINEGYGTKKSIPQMIMAGASVDDVFVIVLFTCFTTLVKGDNIQISHFFQIPVAIFTGILAGFLGGIVLVWFFKKFHIRDSIKVLIFLSCSFLFLTLEDNTEGFLSFSGLLAIMATGMMIYQRHPILAKRLSLKFNKLWIGAEVLLFVLVGALADISYVKKAGPIMILLLLSALLFRMTGVFLSVVGSNLSPKERLFTMIAYCPKATVQAAIGSIPISLGLACGEIILIGAILAILITAPLGAFAIESTYQRFLSKNT